MAAILFYNNITKINDDGILRDIRNAYNKFIAFDDNRCSLRHFSFIISNALVLTGHPEEALFYIEHTKIIVKSECCKHGIPDNTSLYLLLEAHVQFNCGNYKEASKIFDQIKSSEFPFLSRKFSCILYISLLQKIKPKQNNKSEEQLETLINETGFKRLKHI